MNRENPMKVTPGEGNRPKEKSTATEHENKEKDNALVNLNKASIGLSKDMLSAVTLKSQSLKFKSKIVQILNSCEGIDLAAYELVIKFVQWSVNICFDQKRNEMNEGNVRRKIENNSASSNGIHSKTSSKSSSTNTLIQLYHPVKVLNSCMKAICRKCISDLSFYGNTHFEIPHPLPKELLELSWLYVTQFHTLKRVEDWNLGLFLGWQKLFDIDLKEVVKYLSFEVKDKLKKLLEEHPVKIGEVGKRSNRGYQSGVDILTPALNKRARWDVPNPFRSPQTDFPSEGKFGSTDSNAGKPMVNTLQDERLYEETRSQVSVSEQLNFDTFLRDIGQGIFDIQPNKLSMDFSHIANIVKLWHSGCYLKAYSAQSKRDETYFLSQGEEILTVPVQNALNNMPFPSHPIVKPSETKNKIPSEAKEIVNSYSSLYLDKVSNWVQSSSDFIALSVKPVIDISIINSIKPIIDSTITRGQTQAGSENLDLLKMIDNQQHKYEYRISNKLGEGSFGQVYKAESADVSCMTGKAQKTYVAIKIQNNRLVKNEFYISKQIKSRMVEYLSVKGNLIDIDFKNCFGLLTDLFYHPSMSVSLAEYYDEPTLLDFINQHSRKNSKFGGIDERISGKIIYQLIQAILSLHSIGVLHNDVKVDNILVTSLNLSPVPRIRLIDFGRAIDTKLLANGAYFSPEKVNKAQYKPESGNKSRHNLQRLCPQQRDLKAPWLYHEDLFGVSTVAYSLHMTQHLNDLSPVESGHLGIERFKPNPPISNRLKRYELWSWLFDVLINPDLNYYELAIYKGRAEKLNKSETLVNSVSGVEKHHSNAELVDWDDIKSTLYPFLFILAKRLQG